MSTNSKNVNPLNAMHTAGIFSDMTVDGPEIGTLILIIDRAKNLPNRKTIGKQDPYCAARLGKEAKKTTTDIRGGQTPRWDQELRFTVHDSPDYFQLKLSVFNDDKKTELIGETWIDLRGIVVPGGGQSDQWHNLSCKGKYAGNIRIEITYYDSRPKPEKPVARPRPVTSGFDMDAPGPTQRPVVKRRPLPSDPLLGQVRTQAPEPINIPSRSQTNLLNGQVLTHSPSAVGEYITPPSRRHPQHQHPLPDPHSPIHGSGYQLPAPSPHRDYQGRGAPERIESFHAPPYESDPFYQPGSAPHMPYEADSRAIYNNGHSGYGMQAQYAPHHRSTEDVTRPPPPPAHRVRNSNGHSSDMHASRQGTVSMRHGVLRNEAHRYSGPVVPSPSSPYPGRPTYRPFDSAPSLQNGSQYGDYDANRPSTAHHHSYDPTNDGHHRPMQPTVEDVPESWTPPTTRSRSSISQYDEIELDANRHGDILHERYSTGQLQLESRYDSYNHRKTPSPIPSADYSQALTHVPRPHSYHMDQNELDKQMYRSNDLDPSAVPPMLVPGVDPQLARKLSQQFHQDGKRERRYTQPMQMVVHSRSRQHSDPPSHYPASNYSSHGDPAASRPYERAPAGYSGRHNTSSGAAERSDRRGISPSPSAQHTIKRKSVSPAPPPSEHRGVPFGPDSYDVLNPAMAASRDGSNSGDYTNANGKIVTPDGREVDPSDHLPVDTWAPEPEARKPTQPVETRSRPVPSGAQPMPPAGRRPLRITARPQSMTLTNFAPPVSEPSSVSPGRNRLQKKPHRASAMPAPGHSGPLGPASAHQRNSPPSRALVRAHTYDFENHGQPFDRESGPPIPAKVPMMSGGLGPSTSGSGGSEEVALMAEMSRINIGSGRSRRHGRY